jgi:hypothetical protein
MSEVKYYCDHLIEIMRGDGMPDTGWGILSMQVRYYVGVHRDGYSTHEELNAMRNIIVTGLAADYMMPGGPNKVRTTVGLMIDYWSAFEAHGIEAATKLAREAA